MHDLKKENVFLSRWGFHPCDHETYLKLKELKKLFWLAVYQNGAYRRWERKAPHNRYYWAEPQGDPKYTKRVRSDRPIPEPLTCPIWKDQGWWSSSAMLKDDGLLAAFEAARTPMKNATDVQPLKMTTEQIDTLLSQAREWWDNVVQSRKAA